MFKAIDKDNSGSLDANEVWAYHQETAKVMGILPSEEEFQKSFRRLDKDGDGTVTLEEMLSLAKEDWLKLQKSEEELRGGITDDTAFNKGIDWFTEIVFFYGILVSICWWEFKKFNASQRASRQRIANLEENTELILEKLQTVSDKQNSSKKELSEVLNEVEKIVSSNR